MVDCGSRLSFLTLIAVPPVLLTTLLIFLQQTISAIVSLLSTIGPFICPQCVKKLYPEFDLYKKRYYIAIFSMIDRSHILPPKHLVIKNSSC